MNLETAVKALREAEKQVDGGDRHDLAAYQDMLHDLFPQALALIEAQAAEIEASRKCLPLYLRKEGDPPKLPIFQRLEASRANTDTASTAFAEAVARAAAKGTS